MACQREEKKKEPTQISFLNISRLQSKAANGSRVMATDRKNQLRKGTRQLELLRDRPEIRFGHGDGLISWLSCGDPFDKCKVSLTYFLVNFRD